MPDVVVTVPKDFWFDDKTGLAAWIAEGDAAGEPESGIEWYFTLGGYNYPNIKPGERVYIVHNNKLRGYAPLVRLHCYADEDDAAGEFGDLEDCPPRRRIPGFALVRKGGAVAVTIAELIRGFQGFRYRWWEYEQEMPFPDWTKP
jgi:hypothetical protein